MIRQTYTLEIITPCFCAGADQSKAEIRAASIRGQLRWWFRALGGSAEEERAVFGGVAGAGTASSIQLRITALRPGPAWSLPVIDPNSPDSYVWYFASVSGKPPGSGRRTLGPRWTSAGAISPGSNFCLELLQRRPLTEPLKSRYDLALRAFLQLGAIGLRITRGLGAFACREIPFSPAILSEIQNAGFQFERCPGSFNLPQIAKEIGALVKGTRKARGWKIDTMSNRPVSTPSPFGSSDPRQTSAVYFRPIQNADRRSLSLLVFEAPQERVLDRVARKPSVVGQNPSQLVKPDPNPPRHPR